MSKVYWANVIDEDIADDFVQVWEYSHLAPFTKLNMSAPSKMQPPSESNAESNRKSHNATETDKKCPNYNDFAPIAITGRRPWVIGVCSLCGPTISPVFRRDKSNPKALLRICNGCSMYIRHRAEPSLNRWSSYQFATIISTCDQNTFALLLAAER